MKKLLFLLLLPIAYLSTCTNAVDTSNHCEDGVLPQIEVGFIVKAYNVDTSSSDDQFSLQSKKVYCDGTVKGRFDIGGHVDGDGTFTANMKVIYKFSNREDMIQFTYRFAGIGTGTRTVYYEEVQAYDRVTYYLDINTPSEGLARLRKQYAESPMDFRHCQDLPWAVVTGTPMSGGIADKAALYDSLKSTGHVDIEQGFVAEGDSPVPTIEFEDGDIVMLSFENPPGTETNNGADHYAVNYGGKFYQILNWTSMGEFDGPRDFSFFFNERTLFNPVSEETVISPREYQFFKVWRKANY